MAQCDRLEYMGINSTISTETRAAIREQWPAILAALSQGELIKDILAGFGFTRSQIRLWLTSEPGVIPEWDQAREASADALYDEALDVARTPNNSQVAATDARTRIDTLKWAARIRNPRLYGDKQQLDVNVKTVDLTAVIMDANKRLAAAQVGRVIEGEVIRTALDVVPASLEDMM